MRKGIVIVLAVAIIGVLGVYGKSSGKTNSAATPPAAVNGSSSSTTLSDSTSGSTPGSISTSAPAFKDGTYTGDSEETVYGTVQIAAVVSGGKITDIRFLRMPDDRGHTQEVTAYAEPLLKQITLQRQSAHIDFVSGATQTSEGYQQSLQAALNQAA